MRAQATRSGAGVKAALTGAICAGWMQSLPANPSLAAAAASPREPVRVARIGPRRVERGDAGRGGGDQRGRPRRGDRGGIGALRVAWRDAEIGREILRPEAEGEQARAAAVIERLQRRGRLGDERQHADAADRQTGLALQRLEMAMQGREVVRPGAFRQQHRLRPRRHRGDDIGEIPFGADRIDPDEPAGPGRSRAGSPTIRSRAAGLPAAATGILEVDDDPVGLRAQRLLGLALGVRRREEQRAEPHAVAPAAGRRSISAARSQVATSSPFWFNASCRSVTMPASGRDRLSRAETTRVLTRMRVAGEDRGREAHVVHAEIGDGGAERRVVHAHADHEPEGEERVHDRPPELGAFHVFRVEMQAGHVHRHAAEQHVIGLGDRARPFRIDHPPFGEVLEPEPCHRHALPARPASRKSCARVTDMQISYAVDKTSPYRERPGCPTPSWRRLG